MAKDKKEEAAVEETAAEVMLVHGGKDYPMDWEDLTFKGLSDVTPATIGDADLLAAVENQAGLKAGALNNCTIKRPSTGRILISGRSTLG